MSKGDVLVTIYSNEEEKLEAAYEELAGAFVISEDKIAPNKMIKEIIGL